MSGWLTTGEVAPWFGTTARSVLRMVDDPQHAEFAMRVRRRGTQLRFPAALTWHYAHEGRLPESHEELAAFIEVFPVPETRQRGAQLVERAS
jgi:hypothetical protein